MGERHGTILLVDDHAVFGVPLATALEASGFERVVVADPADLSVAAVVATAIEVGPDIVLLDLHLRSDRNSIEMISPLVARGAKVVLFTASEDPHLKMAALMCGAEAVIEKATPFDRMVDALETLAAGGELMTVEERAALLSIYEEHRAALEERHRPFAALTDREAEVLRELISGRSPKEVARARGLSVRTVRTHIQRVLQKLHVSSQREAFALARAAGWPPGDAPPGV